MKLTDILTRECVRAPMRAATKEEAIAELVDLLAEHEAISDRESVLKAVLDRERTASTGIGRGLAVPHGKCTGCDKLVMALGRPEKPLEFASTDGKPVELIVLLASPPDQTGPHIQALARISRLMLMDAFRSEVSASTTADELWDIICKYES